MILDALGRCVALESEPRRIVSLVPSQTELLAALGLDEAVVGITRYCVRPEGWTDRKAIVGGTKKARADRVAALAPDLILANKEENTRGDVEALEAIAPVYVTEVKDLPDALAMIEAVGALVGRERQASGCCDGIRERFEALAAFERRRAAYLIWRNPLMSVGRDTFIHDIMDRAGFDNVFGHLDRYPSLEEAYLKAAAPELVLLSSEPYPFGAEHVAHFEQIVPGARVLLVDGEVFSWYGSRLLEAPAAIEALRAQVD